MNIVLFSEHDNYFFPAQDTRSRHICRILKKKQGDFFEAGIENGRAGKARILSLDEQGLRFEFTPLSDGKPLYPIDMIVGFPRPIQLKRLFRDAAALGVSRILLTGTELGEKSYMKSKIMERGTAYEALKEGSAQAKSTHIPKLEIFASLKKCLDTVLSEPPLYGKDEKINIALDNIQADMPLSTYVFTDKSECKKKRNRKSRHITAAIGSERGWTDKERSLFRLSGFTLCSMGQRVLRTETAAAAAAAIILDSLGVL